MRAQNKTQDKSNLIYGRADITGWEEKMIFSVKVLARWVLNREKKGKKKKKEDTYSTFNKDRFQIDFHMD